jgi:PDZ domain-containing protein
MSTRTALIVVCSVFAAGLVNLAAADSSSSAAKQEEHKDELQALVQQLGSQDVQTRDKASQKLLKAGGEALPLLEKAMRSQDPETRRHVQVVYEQLTRRLQEEATQRLFAKVMQHGLDQCVDQLVRNKRLAREADWALLGQIAQVAAQKGTPKGRDKLLGAEYLKLSLVFSDEVKEESLLRGTRVVTSAVSTGQHPSRTFIVCNGPVESGAISRSVILAVGNVKVRRAIVDCIIVSAGDVNLTGNVWNSVIIARGSVVVGLGPLQDSVILSNSDVTVNEDLRIVDSVILACGRVKVGKSVKGTVLRPNQQDALAPFGFFDPALLGIQVGLTDTALRVTSVTADKPFAQAGVQVGDVIVSVGKARPASVEDFRSLLRRIELEGRATFSLRRGEKVFDVPVTLGDGK